MPLQVWLQTLQAGERLRRVMLPALEIGKSPSLPSPRVFPLFIHRILTQLRARRPNGATQTFRRASTNHATLPHQRESSSSISAQPTSNPQTYLPPHMSAGRNGFTTDARYTRSQLLDLFREQKNLDDLDADLSDLFVGDFDPDAIYDQASSRWSTRDEGNPDAYGPDICIARNIEPTVLHEMTDDEKEASLLIGILLFPIILIFPFPSISPRPSIHP